MWTWTTYWLILGICAVLCAMGLVTLESNSEAIKDAKAKKDHKEMKSIDNFSGVMAWVTLVSAYVAASLILGAVIGFVWYYVCGGFLFFQDGLSFIDCIGYTLLSFAGITVVLAFIVAVMGKLE